MITASLMTKAFLCSSDFYLFNTKRNQLTALGTIDEYIIFIDLMVNVCVIFREELKDKIRIYYSSFYYINQLPGEKSGIVTQSRVRVRQRKKMNVAM